MRKAYWFLIAFFIWAFIFWYHFVFKQQAPAALPIEAPPPLVSPISSSSSSEDKLFFFKEHEYELIAHSASNQIAALIEEGAEDQILKITGYNSEDEERGLDFDLGMARASELKKLLIDKIDENRIEIFSDIKSNFTYHQDSLIDAITYEWVSITTPEVVNAIPQEEFSNENYFLIDHDYKRIKTEEFENIFDNIAERLKETGESVIIKGHTDTDGKKELNFTIALRNAKDIRDVLRKKGVKRAQITTTSRGEEAPIADNTSESGKLKNRRIEIEIR